MRLSRRSLIASGLAAALPLPSLAAPQSLPRRQAPDWFRDAKFGIWAHWGPQCVPECGDWYGAADVPAGPPAVAAGRDAYEHHLQPYGHPSRTGFIDIIGRWKAEHWEPGSADPPLCQGGRALFLRARLPPRQFRQFRRAATTPGTRRASGRSATSSARWAQAGARSAGLRFGVSQPFRAMPGTGGRPPMAMTPKGRCAAGATTPSGCARRRPRQMVGGARPAGALHRA